MNANWKIDRTMILSRTEIASVLACLRPKARRSLNTRMNNVVFRLATCCGLRVSEIGGLRLRDVHVGIARPYLALPAAITKGGKGRRVPLWWDAGTLADLEAWLGQRRGQGAGADDLLICSMLAGQGMKPLTRQALRKRFLTACGSLGAARVADLTIHHGRHSFVSHALAGGRSLAEVRDAAGHSSIGTTSIYTHVARDDGDEPGDLFAFA